jgi:hypothetical protein
LPEGVLAFHAGTRVQQEGPVWVRSNDPSRPPPPDLYDSPMDETPALAAKGIYRYLRLKALPGTPGKSSVEAQMDALLAGPRMVTAGGRVLTLVARAATLDEARRRVYAAAERVSFEGVQYRKDIGLLTEPTPAKQSPGSKAQ